MQDKVIPAIPTKYKGVHFRSRLEARWAAMFDLLDWTWEYEPIDLDGYIPDFILTFQDPILVEVKLAAQTGVAPNIRQLRRLSTQRNQFS